MYEKCITVYDLLLSNRANLLPQVTFTVVHYNIFLLKSANKMIIASTILKPDMQ